jgi:hypothetical protein
MNDSLSASVFTENLLQVIRQQRHLATRVIVATQEPTISPKLLDLSSMTIVHRFTSPDWMGALHAHLASVSGLDSTSPRRDAKELFGKIVTLDAGQALVFAPAAMLEMEGGGGDAVRKPKAQKLGVAHFSMRVRQRLTTDGGKSLMAV